MAGSRGPLGNQNVEVLEAREDRPVPRPPDDLRPTLQTQWTEYWTSAVAQTADTVDLPVITRLFTYRDEWLRHSLAFRALSPEDQIVEGTNNRNTVRIHPLADRMTKLEGEILKLEDRLGLSPLSRARLGIEIGQQKLTWQQLAKAASGNASELEPGSEFSGLPVAGVRS